MARRFLLLLKLAGSFLIGSHELWAQNPAREAGYLYLSPVPGASYVPMATRYILLRFSNVTPTQITNLATGFIEVVGQDSGIHSGTTRVASDGRTVMFVMPTDFTTNELVTVTLNPLLGPKTIGQVQPYQYQFRITAPMPGSLPSVLAPAQTLPWGRAEASFLLRASPNVSPRAAVPNAIRMANGVSVPSDFPKVVITVNTNPSPGYLFLENGLDGVPPYTMILDNSGLPVWYRRGRMYDFKIQKNGMITWAQSDNTGFPAFDKNFKYLKTYQTTNGYNSDGHELKVQADGSYFMIGYCLNSVDMSRYVVGGDPAAIVRETIVQGFTLADDLVLQWRAWDHYDIRDATNNTDFPHLNGLDIDEDGNLVVSARHLSEVTKIDRNSGDILWRLSGAHSSFSFVNDAFGGTSFQHNISALGHSHYMVFDNGDYHIPTVSRAVEYELDLTNMTATTTWQFRDVPDKYAYWLGSAQRLTNGNTLIDFVRPEYPKAIEVDTNGTKHFELSLVPGADSYRAFRLPWNGVVAAPYLVVEPQVDNVTLIFNKFGDRNVAFYRIYGGPDTEPTTILAESTNTLMRLSNLENGVYYFRVTAVSTAGVESPFSNEEVQYVNIVRPGQNLLQNGDFSLGTNSWSFNVTGYASAGWSFSNGVSQFYILQGGNSLSGIQLRQDGLVLVQSNQYVLEFDAWAAQSRYIDVKLAQNVYPFQVYSRISPPFLTPNPTHFRFVVTMQLASDFSASLLFNLGASTAEVFLANVNLYSPPPGDLNLDGRVNFMDLDILAGNWLKHQTGLPGDLNGDGRVDFSDFITFGDNWTPAGPQNGAQTHKR